MVDYVEEYNNLRKTNNVVDSIKLIISKIQQDSIMQPVSGKRCWEERDVSTVGELEYASIHTILLNGRIPMTAQWRPCEGSAKGNGVGEWWTMGMGQAKKIEKGVTHYLYPVILPSTFTKVDVDKVLEKVWNKCVKIDGGLYGQHLENLSVPVIEVNELMAIIRNTLNIETE
jgi:hypothetical protein